MNTYNDNFQQTVITTLQDLNEQQSQLETVKTAAQSTLFYAQGAEQTAKNKLAATEIKTDAARTVKDQAVINVNLAWSIANTSAQAKTNVAASVSNMATAAANIQVASNAITLLASDIGAALNIATASLYNTDTYAQILNANNYINDVANDARGISKTAMEASSAVAEISAANVQAQASAAQSKIANLLKTTQADFNQYCTAAISEHKTIADTSQAKNQAEGKLKDADSEANAITGVYTNASAQLNLGLRVSVRNSKQICVNFTPLPEPFPAFTTPLAGNARLEAPAAQPVYFLVVVPETKSKQFSIDMAGQLFAHNNKPFLRVNASDTQPQQVEMEMSADAFGNAVTAGSNYVVYVLIELAQAYKRYLGNFSDLLSAPSPSFIPLTALPKAWNSIADANADTSGLLVLAAEQVAEQSSAQSATQAATALVTEQEAVLSEVAASRTAHMNMVLDAETAYQNAYTQFHAMAILASSSTMAAVNARKAELNANNELAEAQTELRKLQQEKNSFERDKAELIANLEAVEQSVDENLGEYPPMDIETATEKIRFADQAIVSINSKMTDAQIALTAAIKAQQAAALAAASAETAAQQDNEKTANAQRAVDASRALLNATLGAPHLAPQDTAQGNTTVTFYVNLTGMPETLATQYRCYFVEQLDSAHASTIGKKSNDAEDGSSIIFNAAIAQSLSPCNYQMASLNSVVSSSPAVNCYTTTIHPASTDCFGNLLQANKKYLPYILTVIDGETDDQDLSRYHNTLSKLNAWTCPGQ